MNIRNDIPSIQPLDREFQVSSRVKPGGASGAMRPAAGSDQAHLSSAASLASQAASMPDVRMEKIEALQVAIADGSYNVSSAEVARSMVDAMLGGRG